MPRLWSTSGAIFSRKGGQDRRHFKQCIHDFSVSSAWEKLSVGICPPFSGLSCGRRSGTLPLFRHTGMRRWFSVRQAVPACMCSGQNIVLATGCREDANQILGRNSPASVHGHGAVFGEPAGLLPGKRVVILGSGHRPDKLAATLEGGVSAFTKSKTRAD